MNLEELIPETCFTLDELKNLIQDDLPYLILVDPVAIDIDQFCSDNSLGIRATVIPAINMETPLKIFKLSNVSS
jgi:hypothetical protein